MSDAAGERLAWELERLAGERERNGATDGLAAALRRGSCAGGHDRDRMSRADR